MALSQKHAGKILVPWFNSLEWKHVYSLIYSKKSTKSDKQKALEILQVWKARMPILFGGLEGTITILSAMLLDKNAYTQNDLSNLYGLAIMRFLNLCAANSDQGTFFRVAKERNLPDWLVNIRHELAHSQKQSSLYMREKGIEYCFKWLKREYWEIQDIEIKDFIASDDSCENLDILNTYCQLVIAMIKQDELPTHIMSILKKLRIPKNINLKKVLKELIGNQKFTKSTYAMASWLVIDNYLFKIPLKIVDKIPKVQLQCWNPLIQYMYENNMLMEFIKGLNNICSKNETDNAPYLSSLWLKEIFSGLILGNKGTTNINEHKNYESGLILHGTCPQFLSELRTFANEVIDNPHIFLPNFVVSLMQLCEYKKTYIKHVTGILRVYYDNGVKILTDENYQPYTADGINRLLKSNIHEELCPTSEHTEPIITTGFRKIENTDIYEGCPIGVLPSQSREFNPLIDLKK